MSLLRAGSAGGMKVSISTSDALTHIHLARPRKSGLSQASLAPPKEGFKPLKPFSESHDLSNHGEHRRLEFFDRRRSRNIDQSGYDCFLRIRCSPSNQSNRCIGAASMGEKLLRDPGQILNPHEDYQGVHRSRQARPVDVRSLFRRVLVAGDDSE